MPVKRVSYGDMVDQSTFFTDLKNTSFQDNANEAIHRFIKVSGIDLSPVRPASQSGGADTKSVCRIDIEKFVD